MTDVLTFFKLQFSAFFKYTKKDFFFLVLWYLVEEKQCDIEMSSVGQVTNY